MKRVYVQGEPHARTGPEDLSLWRISNANGQFVDFSTFATQNWIFGPQQVSRYNALPAMKLEGSPASGFSSGDAIAEMERLADNRSEEHTSELPSLMRHPYAIFCLKK